MSSYNNTYEYTENNSLTEQFSKGLKSVQMYEKYWIIILCWNKVYESHILQVKS